jgi:hypothetical protein
MYSKMEVRRRKAAAKRALKKAEAEKNGKERR